MEKLIPITKDILDNGYYKFHLGNLNSCDTHDEFNINLGKEKFYNILNKIAVKKDEYVFFHKIEKEFIIPDYHKKKKLIMDSKGNFEYKLEDIKDCSYLYDNNVLVNLVDIKELEYDGKIRIINYNERKINKVILQFKKFNVICSYCNIENDTLYVIEIECKEVKARVKEVLKFLKFILK